MKSLAIAIILSSFLCVISLAQEKKVELKAEVKLDLVKDQNELYKLALQMKNLESQYTAAQAQFAKLQGKLQADTKDALSKSGLDAEKYEINVETFDVTPKVVKDASVPGKEAQKAVSQ